MVADPRPILDELHHLLASPALRNSPSQQRLLRYLVEHALAQDVKALREIVIGVVVFRRQAATYDPKKDPIVRVSVGRLRQRLAEHYGHDHPPTGVRIEIPTGTYRPRFVAAPGGQARAPRVLVPPIEGTGMAPGMADLAHEFLIEELHTVPALEVVGYQTAAGMAALEPWQTARKLKAHFVLRCRLARSGSRLRGHATLSTVSDHEIRASFGLSDDASDSDAHFVQAFAELATDKCGQEIAGLLRGEFTVKPGRRGFRGIGAAAIDAYRTARVGIATGTATARRNAATALEQAIALAPDFAIAHALKASPASGLPDDAAVRAFAADPFDPRAALAMASRELYREYRFARAGEILHDARRLRGNDPELLLLSGRLATYRAEHTMAKRILENVRRIDPLNKALDRARARASYLAGRFAEAARIIRPLSGASPEDVELRLLEAYTLIGLGDHAAALNPLRAISQAMPKDRRIAPATATALAACGDTGTAADILSRAAAPRNGLARSCFDIAIACARLGETDRGVSFLERSASAQEWRFAEVQVEPMLAPLTRCSGFHRLLDHHRLHWQGPAPA